MSNRPEGTIATLTICYTDADGDMTERGVSVTEFDPYEMFGLCHLRQQYRTFLYERVASCVDVKTGEVIANIHKHLSDTYSRTPIFSLDQLEKNNRATLQVLLYLAKADGRMTAAERKVMTAACKALTGDVRITDDMTARLFNDMDVPSLNAFKRAVGSIANRGDNALMKRLLIACNTMVRTEKKASAAEQEALGYLAKRFRLIEPTPPPTPS